MARIVVYDPGAAVVDAVIEYNPSANTPDYDSEPNKLVNPDVSLLEGIVPVRFWKRVGSTVVEMNQTEKETIAPIQEDTSILNDGAFDPPTENAGWEVDRGGVEDNAILRWNETNNEWEFGVVGDLKPVGSIQVQEEGVDLGDFAKTVNFVGSGVTAVDSGSNVTTVTITAGGGDVTAAANLVDNSLVRGDGGAKGIQDSDSLWILNDDGFMDVTVNRTGHALSIRQNNATDGEFISMVNSAGLDVFQFNKNLSEDGIWRVRMGNGNPYFEADFGVVKIGDTANGPNASYTLLVDHGNIGISNTSDQIVGIDVPTTGITAWTLTLPPSSGNANEFLQTDGAGNTVWAPVATGGASVQLIWKFDATTTAADPGSGFFRLNNANPALATNIYISKDTETGPDASTLLNALSDGDSIYLQQEEDGTRFVLAVISSNTDNGAWHTLAITVSDSGTLFEDGKECIGVLLYSGDGNVDAAGNLANNALIRGDGGAKGIQDSGILIDDNDNMSGVGQIVLEHDSNSQLDVTIDPNGLFGAAGFSISKGASGGGFMSLMPNSEILQWIAASPTAASGANIFYFDVDNQGEMRFNTLPGAGRTGDVWITYDAALLPGNQGTSDLGSTTQRWQDLYAESIILHNAADETVGIDLPASGVTNWTLTLPIGAGLNGQVLTTDGSGNASWTTPTTGDVTSSGNITDNSIVRGDGGAKGVQDSEQGTTTWTIADNGKLVGVGDNSGDYIMTIRNLNATSGSGFSVQAGEALGDIAFSIQDSDGSFIVMELEADQGYTTFGKSYAQTLIDNGVVYGVDNQNTGTTSQDFNTDQGTYRKAGVEVIPPQGGTGGQVLTKIDGTNYNWQWDDVGLPDNPTIGGDEKITIPTGTTAQRPSSPVGGDLRYNTTDGKFEGYENGAWIRFRQEDVVLARYTFFADQVDFPVTGSDWNVTVGAPASSDSNNSSLTVRLFDDTVTEAIGFVAKVPDNATTMIVRTKTRAETGAAQDVAFQLHRRVIPDNGAIGGWNVSTLTIVDVTADERWQLDESSNTLANWSISAGDTVQFMLARNPGLVADTLVGDAALLFVELEFKA